MRGCLQVNLDRRSQWGAPRRPQPRSCGLPRLQRRRHFSPRPAGGRRAGTGRELCASACKQRRRQQQAQQHDKHRRSAEGREDDKLEARPIMVKEPIDAEDHRPSNTRAQGNGVRLQGISVDNVRRPRSTWRHHHLPAACGKTNRAVIDSVCLRLHPTSEHPGRRICLSGRHTLSLSKLT